MCTIDELIAAGEAKLQAEEEKRRAEREEKKRQADSERLERVERFKADVLGALDERLHPFVMFADYEHEGGEPAWYCDVTIRVSGCADVLVYFENNDREHWTTRGPVLYKIPVPEKSDGYVRYRDYQPCTTNDLDTALALARRSAEKFEIMKAILEAEEQKGARELAEYEERQEALKLDREKQSEVEDADRQAMVDFLAGDPVAFYLMRAMAALVTEREAWQDKLDGYNEAMSAADDWHAWRMQQADERARELERRADDERRRAEDAEYEAEQAKKRAARSCV